MIFLPMFGSFEPEELKKFLRLGLLFSLIIGTYWSLGTLKVALFSNFVGAVWQSYARIVSMVAMIGILMFYTKLLDKMSRERIFYYLSAFYVVGVLFFSVSLLHPTFFQIMKQVPCASDGMTLCAVQVFSYAFAVFCDSYILLIALFWAIVTDTTLPESAKNGFSLIVAVGQLGGIFLPLFITRVPAYFKLTTHFFSVLLCVLPIICSIFALKNFFKKTPSDLLVSFRGVNACDLQAKKVPGFLEGLRLLARNPYLIGIFCVVVFPDILATIFDMHFNLVAEQQYPGVALAGYYGIYASTVNSVTLLLLLFGVNNITRKLGVGVALLIIPVYFAGALLGFFALNSLNFLFGLMVSVKAINYALSVPAIKQLYIPTVRDTRFKAQAWIEAFGPNTSKLSGSVFNMILLPLQRAFGLSAGRAFHVLLGSYFGLVLIILWVVIASILGCTYTRAVKENKVVC